MDKETCDSVTAECKDVYKKCLEILEDLQAEHRIHFDKLKENLPPELENVILQADYFTDAKMKHLRKRVLDSGNHAVRNIGEILHYTIINKK